MTTPDESGPVAEAARRFDAAVARLDAATAAAAELLEFHTIPADPKPSRVASRMADWYAGRGDAVKASLLREWAAARAEMYQARQSLDARTRNASGRHERPRPAKAAFAPPEAAVGLYAEAVNELAELAFPANSPPAVRKSEPWKGREYPPVVGRNYRRMPPQPWQFTTPPWESPTHQSDQTSLVSM